MLGLLRQHRRFFFAFALAGLALRLLFFFIYPCITDDSRIYADFATNLLQHGTYGRTAGQQVMPADSRLPGYPLFLAAIFALFGVANFKAVLLVQIFLDLITCLLIADLARRTLSDRAAQLAFALAALCPFFANYAAAALTETLEVLFTTLALVCAVAGMQALDLRMPWRNRLAPWITTGLSVGACILLRPDGGILLASLGIYLLIVLVMRRRDQKAAVSAAGIATLLGAALLLLPWTLRNFHTLHHFQPLAPRYATEQDELAPRGFNRWVGTWIADYVSVEEVYWNVPGAPIDPALLPDRAFDSPDQRQQTLQLIADYNRNPDLTPELDARFGNLAAERARAHPLRHYLWLPLLRIADMWLRPRVELLPPDPRWWQFNDVPSSSVLAVGFGILNLGYVGAACWGLVARRRLRFLGLLLMFVVLRSAFLGSLENPETRYTLECYPLVILIAAAALASRRNYAISTCSLS